MAAGNGHYDVCKLFMEKIEDPNPTVNPGNSFKLGGLNPLDMAARNGHLKICGLIQGYLTYEAFFNS